MAVVVNTVKIVSFGSNGVEVTVLPGVAIPGSTPAFLIAGSDGTNARYIRTATDGTVRVDPTGTTTQPISAASLPLPTGAATEATLATLLTTSAFQARINTLGQKTMANSTPVVISSDQSTITITGTVTANIGTTNGLALDATVTAQSIVDNAGFSDAVTRVTPAGFILDETAGTALTENDAAAARIDSKRAQVLVVEDAATRGQRLTITAANAAKVDGSAVTQPISAASLPLPAGAATEATLATLLTTSAFQARINTLGQKTMANSTPVVISSDQTQLTVTQGAAAALSGYWPVRITDGTNTHPTADVAARASFTKVTDGTNTMPTGDTVARSVFHQISDGTNGPATVKAASTAPVAADKALVVVLSPNQQSIPVSTSPSNATTGSRAGYVTLSGGSSGSLNAIRATTYNEQTTNATRSMASSSANDTSAGTGARTVEITYYDQAGAGPFTTTVTLNGTTAVATSVSDICFIEKMEVKTVGSGGSNAGTITLYVNNTGGGGTIGTIGIGNVFTGVGDNKTLWAHHYVSPGTEFSLTALVFGATASSTFHIKFKDPTNANSPERVLTEVMSTQAEFLRSYGSPPTITGPARVVVYGVPSTNGVTLNAGFDFFES